MKIRTDFVTNSSSSSFLVAKKGDLNDIQKEQILNYVISECFGGKINVTCEEIDNYLRIMEEAEREKKSCYELYKCDSCPGAKACDMNLNKYKIDKLKNAISNGMDIYSGSVDFEYDFDNNARMIKDVWKILEENNSDNFMGIDTKLSY
ncbi:MAG: hypothetical protein J6P57_02425 [Lachnospiraceae bacterium]|nr:hypothetical protein [Lachnospiraceae bacterium]